MSPLTIRGWFMEIPSWPGRVGIHTRESGMAARTFRSELVLGSATSADTDGAGTTGDLIGITAGWFTTTTPITPGAQHFTTGTITTEEGARRILQPSRRNGQAFQR